MVQELCIEEPTDLPTKRKFSAFVHLVTHLLRLIARFLRVLNARSRWIRYQIPSLN